MKCSTFFDRPVQIGRSDKARFPSRNVIIQWLIPVAMNQTEMDNVHVIIAISISEHMVFVICTACEQHHLVFV